MEADVLRWSLLIIGSLVIVGLAVHGIWLSRKNGEKKSKANKRNNDQQYQPSGWQSDDDKFDDLAIDANDDMVEDSDHKFDFTVDDIPSTLAESAATKNEFDDLGLGAVRVVSGEPKVDMEAAPEPLVETNTEAEPEAPTSTSKIYASVVTQPKPEYAAKYSSLAADTVAISQQERATSNKNSGSEKVLTPQFTAAPNNAFSSNDGYQAPEPPPFLLKKEVSEPQSASDTHVETVAPAATAAPTKSHATVVDKQKEAEEKPHATLAEKLSLSEQARNLVKRKKADSLRKRREPKMAEDQLRIDFDDEPVAEPELKEAKAKSVEPSAQQPEQRAEQEEQPQEVLVLNVKSADDNPIPGSALLPMLLTLGFKFGEQDIFHRHVNSNGKGPVLFSLANMFKPGNFDIDSLENFTTQGISLFMILPIEGEPHQVFNMMHNAARKIAEEFSAQIYDGKRTLLTKQSLQQYVEKIREFERQRLLKG
ncbi:cell division protein ZipA [Paraglaciecola arctica]|uniref:Cell division protein ZipA n=1 Tax=Paraglaciecola arctica BSs20135 TaxID=493475 RepID=K6YLP9_9ALTE|nr:cell division protein ZipA [Paraglaciecola arctica]GAC17563.1 cell division protein ZipA [Paraglaciecola arctica BSs20135]